ncbi:hypothetical protein NDU88_002990 [Pleurodeles waltl]|uniref:Uncharacterized protein n=1 Tax=Pleurodeles waltl TaxID=8319 RepID=A0AAV7SD89_PLEWA|nr:hypothetical protein NDU88_002990 [Pleurodeles waltl]
MGKDKWPEAQALQGQIDQYMRSVGATDKDQPPMGMLVPTDHVASILQATLDLLSSLERKMGELKVNMYLLRQDLCNMTSRVAEADGPISTMEDILRQTTVPGIQNKVHLHSLPVDNAEGRSSCSNIRNMGS